MKNDEELKYKIRKFDKLPSIKLSPTKFNLLMNEYSCPLWATKEGFVKTVKNLDTNYLIDIKEYLKQNKLEFKCINNELEKRIKSTTSI